MALVVVLLLCCVLLCVVGTFVLLAAVDVVMIHFSSGLCP